MCVLTWNNVDRFVGTCIWHTHTQHIHTQGEHMNERPILCRGELTSPAPLLIRRKWDSRSNSRLGRQGQHWAKRRPVGSVLRKSLERLKRADIYRGSHPTHCSEGAPAVQREEEKCALWDGITGCFSHWAGKTGEKKWWMSWEASGHMWACHAPGFWQWGNHSDSAILPLKLKGRRKCKPWRTHKCLRDFLVSLPHLEMESHFRSRGHLWEGSSQDCHLGLEPAFIFHVELFSLIRYIA